MLRDGTKFSSLRAVARLPRGSDSGQPRPSHPGMPTIARIGPYRFFFFSNETGEPPHVHVQRDRSVAKFWLRPVRLAASWGYDELQINRIYRLVREHRFGFLKAWNEFHRREQ